MDFIVKTRPLSQATIGKAPFSIIAVRGRIFDLEVSLKDTELQASFYFEFLDEKKSVVNQTNATRNSIFSGVISQLPSSLTDEQKTAQANQLTDQTIKAIIAGTKEQRFAAMSSFAKSYGLTLLPLSEQTGKFEEEKSVVEETTN